MHAYSTDGWGELFLAGAGASAALAGLLFVAMSINLERILQGAGLPGRAGEAIVLLVAVLVVSMLGWGWCPARRRRCWAPNCSGLGWSPG